MENATFHDDYRMILKEELDSRLAHNPNYSLRAFARDLSISPSRLSEILNYKQGLSRPAAEKIAAYLNLTSDEYDYFLDLVTAAHARSPKDRQGAKARVLRYKAEHDAFYQMKTDTFKIISDWFHLGILELCGLGEVQDDPRNLGKRLGITPIQAELAVDRLIRVGLLERKEKVLKPLTNTGWIQSEVPSESIRKFHRQILQKAIDALAVQSIGEREFNSNVLTISKKDIPEAKAAIRKFQQRFCANVKETSNHDELYCLAIQFFSLSETKGDL